jgi:hypothetical protein
LKDGRRGDRSLANATVVAFGDPIFPKPATVQQPAKSDPELAC